MSYPRKGVARGDEVCATAARFCTGQRNCRLANLGIAENLDAGHYRRFHRPWPIDLRRDPPCRGWADARDDADKIKGRSLRPGRVETASAAFALHQIVYAILILFSFRSARPGAFDLLD